MRPASWLTRQLLRLIPERWRESVARDLHEEATRGRRGATWQGWHLLRIATTLRFGRVHDEPATTGGPPAWTTSLRNLDSDIKQAARTIRSRPWSTTAVVVTLAIGTGASTAVYAVFNYALFRPVPGIRDEASLVSLRVRPNQESRSEIAATFAHFAAMRAMPAFAGLATYWSQSYPTTLRGGTDPRMVDVTAVSLEYFSILGATPAQGRLFSQDEYETPDTMLAVISERLWRTAAGGDPRIVGSSIHIIDRPFTVIGVVRDFRGLSRVGSNDIWVPLGATAALTGSGDVSAQRMIGRLAPDATLAAAREQAASAFERVGVIKRGDQTYTAVTFSGLTDGINLSQSRMRALFFMAAGGSGLLLLLACANGAGLLISRNLGRRRDVSLKLALGAHRFRLFRELFIEVASLGVLSAALGLAVAALLTQFFRTLKLAAYMPPLADLSLDWRVTVFAAAAAGATVILAGVLPSVLASRVSPQSGLRDFARGSSRSGALRQALTVVQVALSLALVAGASVLGLSVVRLQSVGLGFEPDRLYSIDLRPRDVGRQPARPFFDEVERRLASTAGIDATAFAQFHHIGTRSSTKVQLQPVGPQHSVITREISADYFRTLGIPLLSGRSLTPAEISSSARSEPVVIDDLMARQLFGDASPIGQVLYTTFPSLARHEIVGVVGSSGSNLLRENRIPSMYEAAGDLRIATMFVRTLLPPAEAAATIRRVVREVEPRLAADTITTTAAIVDDLTAEERVLARLALVLSVLGLCLAMSGVYAAIAFAVHERTREFGIRMALGATARSLGRGVLRRTAGIAGVGLAGGLALYAWGSQYIAAKLFGTSALDPFMLAGACVLLLGSALVAAWLPARRATRVDPTIALRAQ